MDSPVYLFGIHNVGKFPSLQTYDAKGNAEGTFVASKYGDLLIFLSQRKRKVI